MAGGSFVRDFAEGGVLFLGKALVLVMLFQKSCDAALFRFRIEGTRGNLGEIDVFLVQLPGNGVAIAHAIEPSSLPSHKTAGRKLRGQCGVFWREELELVQRNGVSNRPW